MYTALVRCPSITQVEVPLPSVGPDDTPHLHHRHHQQQQHNNKEVMKEGEEEGDLVMPRRQVLIPVDGTPQSEYMIDWALSNFCREGDQVNLLHVIPKCAPPHHSHPPLDHGPSRGK